MLRRSPVFSTICSSVSLSALGVLLILSLPTGKVALAQSDFPACSSANSDTDGDGWGWENNRSCIVGGQLAKAQVSPTLSFPTCQRSDSDPDGDGYGWENNRSCLVSSASQSSSQSGNSASTANSIPACSSAASDPDGDGYGWENGRTCTVTAASSKVQSTEKAPSVSAATSGDITVNDITDIVLVTGQSNVLASGTGYDAWLDLPDSQVFAYTNNGWQMADLHQVWDRFQHPGVDALKIPGKDPVNSFAFHFGKALVNRDVSRVAAFIVVPGPGKGISNWDAGTAMYQLISNKVTAALAEIPHKNTIDAVLWHQGENDWLYEGTADANPTGFSSKDSYEYRNYYQIKLDALISNFRGEAWARSDTGFICGETRRAEGVNRRLMALNSDDDPRTACVTATDLPKRPDDPYGSHFSAAGLRALGQRYADAYLDMN